MSLPTLKFQSFRKKALKSKGILVPIKYSSPHEYQNPHIGNRFVPQSREITDRPCGHIVEPCRCFHQIPGTSANGHCLLQESIRLFILHGVSQAGKLETQRAAARFRDQLHGCYQLLCMGQQAHHSRQRHRASIHGAPIFVFFFIRLLYREPIKRGNLVTLLLGMLGIAIIFSGSTAGQDLQGVTAAIFSGFLFSIYMVNLRYLKEFNPLILTFINNMVCALTLFPLVGFHLALSSGQFLALGIMGVIQLGIPYFLFSKGLESISLQEASLIVLIEPVLNPIWVVWGVGEVPSTATLIGAGVILFSLAVRYLRFTGT